MAIPIPTTTNTTATTTIITVAEKVDVSDVAEKNQGRLPRGQDERDLGL